MSKPAFFACVSVSAYGAVFIALLISFLLHPVDQILWLGLISFPGDLAFFAIGSKDWSVFIQAALVGVCGAVQYGGLGALVGYLARAD